MHWAGPRPRTAIPPRSKQLRGHDRAVWTSRPGPLESYTFFPAEKPTLQLQLIENKGLAESACKIKPDRILKSFIFNNF